MFCDITPYLWCHYVPDLLWDADLCLTTTTPMPFHAERLALQKLLLRLDPAQWILQLLSQLFIKTPLSFNWPHSCQSCQTGGRQIHWGAITILQNVCNDIYTCTSGEKKGQIAPETMCTEVLVEAGTNPFLLVEPQPWYHPHLTVIAWYHPHLS